MVNGFYQGLPSNYANYGDIILPKHESMREKIRREGIYGYHDHWNKDAYTWIDRFLEDSVGKKFDSVYPKVCEKFRKKKVFKFRDKFKSRIEPRNMSDVYWHRNDYYLDSDHIIRRYEPIKKAKRRKYVMELDRSEDYYVVNKEKLLKYPEIILYLKSKYGAEVQNNVPELLATHPNIRKIVLNGVSRTKKYFDKYFKTLYQQIEIVAVNSSSNKNRHVSSEEKLQEWKNRIM